ncbi:hypothetical protein [Streptomyces sp. NPDC093089]|uniref:hypothetical protein n=1 Tax=Streptomyces sp. NPDC093089 TaxID=3366024 RepID=UPI0037F420C6
MVSQTSDLGDVAKPGDESCVTAHFARNTGTWLVNRVYRTEVVAGACDGAISRPADVISDNRSFFDGSTTPGTAPTKGDVTRVEQINALGTGYDVTRTVPVADYDVYGRPLSSTDYYGKKTTTVYSPAAGEVPTSSVTTNPLGHQITTVSDPLRAKPTSVTDANNRVTTTAYDPLGRVVKIWAPTRSAVTYPDSPSHTFAYTVRNDGPNIVTSSSLDHNSVYKTSYVFYDGLLRVRQSQSPSPDGAGRLVSENFYDTRGLAWRTSGTFFATGPAEPALVTGQNLNYPGSTATEYDGAGRITGVRRGGASATRPAAPPRRTPVIRPPSSPSRAAPPWRPGPTTRRREARASRRSRPAGSTDAPTRSPSPPTTGPTSRSSPS